MLFQLKFNLFVYCLVKNINHQVVNYTQVNDSLPYISFDSQFIIHLNNPLNNKSNYRGFDKKNSKILILT